MIFSQQKRFIFIYSNFFNIYFEILRRLRIYLSRFPTTSYLLSLWNIIWIWFNLLYLKEKKIFLAANIFFFHTVHGVLKARIWKWFAIPFSSGPHSVRPLHHDPPILGGPTGHGCFIELDKAVVHVIRLASFLWLWFQCVCPLMPSWNTYRLTWVSLTLDLGLLFTAAPAKRSHYSLPWARGISSPPPFLNFNVG